MTEILRNIAAFSSTFIVIATGTMILLQGCIFLFSAFTVRNDVRHIMDYIVDNDGELPIPDYTGGTYPQPAREGSQFSGRGLLRLFFGPARASSYGRRSSLIGPLHLPVAASGPALFCQ